jgi:ketosteroid isomerase-like protein
MRLITGDLGVSQEEDNKQLVRQFFEAMSSGDVEFMVNAYDDAGTVQTMGSTLISGIYDKEQIRGFANGIYEAFPQGLSFTVVGVTAEGERVAVEAESNGKHASGKDYNNFYHFLFTIRDGRILSLKEYLDTELVTEILAGGQRLAQ